MDSLSPGGRSEIMARVRSRNSRPEMVVRELVFALGYRCRLHARQLPGHPDIVYRARHKVIFAHRYFGIDTRGAHSSAFQSRDRNSGRQGWKATNGVTRSLGAPQKGWMEDLDDLEASTQEQRKTGERNQEV